MKKKKTKNAVRCIIYKGNYEELLEAMANIMNGQSLDIQKGNLLLLCS